MKHCLKQVVKASLVRDGEVVVVAFNDIANDDVVQCPRADRESGEDYLWCSQLCRQDGHAEIQAIKRAKYLDINIRGCTLVLEGHSFICEECQKQLIEAGVKEWVLTTETQ